MLRLNRHKVNNLRLRAVLLVPSLPVLKCPRQGRADLNHLSKEHNLQVNHLKLQNLHH
jgi:hypothetical protein